jgi:hypothetical protein
MAVKPAKLTDDTGTREMHTNLLMVMPFQMHTVPGAKNSYIAAEPVGEQKIGLV